MLERTVPKNVHDPYLYQSPRISVDIAFRCLDRRPSQHRPHDRQILHAYIWPETPNGISIPLHYGSYVCLLHSRLPRYEFAEMKAAKPKF